MHEFAQSDSFLAFHKNHLPFNHGTIIMDDISVDWHNFKLKKSVLFSSLLTFTSLSFTATIPSKDPIFPVAHSKMKRILPLRRSPAETVLHNAVGLRLSNITVSLSLTRLVCSLRKRGKHLLPEFSGSHNYRKHECNTNVLECVRH